MNEHTRSLDKLSDRDLIAEVKRLAGCERAATAQLIASLAELDARRLYLGEGCSSLFTYCTQVLHLSEDAAYSRIEVARLSRRCPVVLEYLTAGAVHLTALRLLGPHLTAENSKELLDAARHKSKREIEQLIARLRPRPDVPTVVRKLPGATLIGGSTDARTATPATVPTIAATSATAPAAAAPVLQQSHIPSLRPAVVAPLAPERYKVQLTVSRETHDKLRRVQDLMRHVTPGGDLAVIFDRALTLLLESLERKKLAAVRRPRPCDAEASRSRHIPAAVRRAVWKRDGGRCAFKGANGRCTETGFLEFHHVVAYAGGGETSIANVELRCRAHNAYESGQEFGAEPWTLREWRPVWPA